MCIKESRKRRISAGLPHRIDEPAAQIIRAYTRDRAARITKLGQHGKENHYGRNMKSIAQQRIPCLNSLCRRALNSFRGSRRNPKHLTPLIPAPSPPVMTPPNQRMSFVGPRRKPLVVLTKAGCGFRGGRTHKIHRMVKFTRECESRRRLPLNHRLRIRNPLEAILEMNSGWHWLANIVLQSQGIIGLPAPRPAGRRLS